MAMSLNRVQLIGNLTRDPELRQIPGGSTVATFGLATNFTWTDQSGQRQEKVEFHNIVAWKRLAEICGQYLKKGSKVYVEGRIQTREWEGEDGVKRYRTEIVMENMIMLDKKGSFEDAGSFAPMDRSKHSGIQKNSASADNDQAAALSPKPAFDQQEVAIDDLPF